MMKVRNLGRKSLEEVLAKLKELGLELNHSESKILSQRQKKPKHRLDVRQVISCR